MAAIRYQETFTYRHYTLELLSLGVGMKLGLEGLGLS